MTTILDDDRPETVLEPSRILGYCLVAVMLIVLLVEFYDTNGLSGTIIIGGLLIIII